MFKNKKNKEDKVSKFNTSDKWFWVKIAGFLGFTLLILTSIVAFVGVDMPAYYGTKIENGMGIFAMAIGWAFWFSSIESKEEKSWIKGIVASALVIIGVSIMPSLLGAIFGALTLVLTVGTTVYRIKFPNDLPKTLG